jgi:aminocarboxymuconate-semialdehyde decarboxylase
MKIDVHTHLFPVEYLKELEGLGDDSRRDRAWKKIMTDKVCVTPSMWSVEERIADMDAAGVDAQALSLSIPNVYFEDVGKSVYLAQMSNDIYADICRKYPNRFIALASVPMNDSTLAIEELRRAVDHLGMRGLVLGANVRGKPLHSEEFLPLFEEMNRRNLTLFIHPMIPIGIEALEQFDMAASIGYLFDTTTAIAGMVFRGIFEMNQNIKVILPHLGAVIPYIVGRIDASFRTRPECRQYISSPPSEYFKRFYYDTVNYHVPALRCAIETVGAAKLVMGSDYPFGLGSMSKSVSTIQSLGLSEEEEEGVFGRTVQRLLSGSS